MSSNISPDFWGPYFWKTIHLAIIGLPDILETNHKKALIQFFNSLIYLLPCQNCRNHYSSYIEENPLNVSSKHAIWLWSVNLHNSVNKRSNKKIYTTEEKNSDSTSSITLFLIALCLVLSVIIVVKTYYPKRWGFTALSLKFIKN